MYESPDCRRRSRLAPVLEASLRRWGYDVIVATDGREALGVLEQPDGPKLVIFDWMMPGLDGIQLCERIRARPQEPYVYILLLTSKARHKGRRPRAVGRGR